jgi:hypothetical protein
VFERVEQRRLLGGFLDALADVVVHYQRMWVRA